MCGKKGSGKEETGRSSEGMDDPDRGVRRCLGSHHPGCHHPVHPRENPTQVSPQWGGSIRVHGRDELDTAESFQAWILLECRRLLHES